jgi:four helix bundle protein
MGVNMIRKFEDIKAWQKARELNRYIFKLTDKTVFLKDLYLKSQLRKSSISVMLNISEGYGRGSNKEFKQFLYIAHGSIAEVQSCLYIALDQNYISENEFYKLYNQSNEISKIIAGFIGYLGRKK